jgi:hypothetical protein
MITKINRTRLKDWANSLTHHPNNYRGWTWTYDSDQQFKQRTFHNITFMELREGGAFNALLSSQFYGNPIPTHKIKQYIDQMIIRKSNDRKSKR